MIAKPTGMNAIIAEHVFGWKWDKHWAGGCWIIPERYRDWDSGEPQVSPPNFTEDIADAWQVVEKLALQGRALALQAPGSTDMNECYRTFPKWTADFEFRLNSEAEADTAPLAICLAALKACGVEVK